MKKILIALLLVVVVIVVAGATFVFAKSKPLPSGEEGPVAEALVDEMLEAINHEAWQKTGAIKWNFGGRQQHLWDKDRHLAKVSWDDLDVVIDLSTRQGVVYQQGVQLEEGKEVYLEKAWAHWANDSYWLNPISKLRDKGTTRQFITMPDGLRGLLVTYASGGVTPGDSYLWVVDDSGLPVRFEMWVSIIPLKGAAATWENWTTLSTGVKVSQFHDLGLFELPLTDIKAAETLEALEGELDPFAILYER